MGTTPSSFHSCPQRRGLTKRLVFAEKDVNRTDRTTSFYEGVDNPRLGLLNDILMTYCMYDFDLGETLLPLETGPWSQLSFVV